MCLILISLYFFHLFPALFLSLLSLFFFLQIPLFLSLNFLSHFCLSFSLWLSKSLLLSLSRFLPLSLSLTFYFSQFLSCSLCFCFCSLTFSLSNFLPSGFPPFLSLYLCILLSLCLWFCLCCCVIRSLTFSLSNFLPSGFTPFLSHFSLLISLSLFASYSLSLVLFVLLRDSRPISSVKEFTAPNLPFIENFLALSLLYIMIIIPLPKMFRPT